MNNLMDELSKRFPKVEVISWKWLENQDSLGFNSLAKLLAKEIIGNIKKIEDLNVVCSISMIGHSMGGLIIRAALKYLKRYRFLMNTLITLGTPHLGYLHSNSHILTTGIWIANKCLRNKTLSEINLSDSRNHNTAFLYKLSLQKSIEWFKTIIVVGSEQDSIGSLESSTIQNSERIGALSNSRLIESMIENILSNLVNTKFYRLRVDFDIQSKSFDTFIGRKAHIELLYNNELFKMIISRFHNVFE